jgi:ATP-dependent exoDNAse (exonuclease V) beta subunit
MSEAPLADAQQRALAVDGTDSVLLQAPAGSGKTTLLVQRYLRLLGEAAAPENILALTFTRLAAREMRERVIAALRAARESATNPTLDPRTLALAQRARAHLEAQGIDLEVQPARLRIETIDAFNAWLSGQLPLAAGAAGLPVLSDAGPAYREAARRALGHEGADAFGEAVHRTLELDDQRWGALVGLIAAMLPGRDRWLPLLAGGLQASAPLDASTLASLRAGMDADLEVLVKRVLAPAHAAIGNERLLAIGALYQRAGVPGGPDLELEPTAAAAPHWRWLARELMTQKSELRIKAPGSITAKDDRKRMAELLQELKRDGLGELISALRELPEARYSDAQFARVRDVAQVLVFAAAQLDTVFRETGGMDFTAVSLAAQRALDEGGAPTDLALKLDYRLQHLLVDEFQDTSSAQLELVRLLTAGWSAGDGRSVFCVGDPMQSIYGFRQAEVRAFLELAERGLGSVAFQVARLATNFRSEAAIVEWVNRTFAAILPQSDDRERGAIAFRASVARHPSSQGGGVDMRAFRNQEAEAQTIAERIAEALAAHPAWRIAVLVRARNHAFRVALALKAAGIAYRAVEIESLGERPVIRDLLMLLRALSHLADRIAWLALLRAPWCGLSLADLWQLARAPVIYEALASPHRLSALSEEGRVRAQRLRSVLERAFACRDSMPVSRWLESVWLNLAGPAVCGAQLPLAAELFKRLRELEAWGLPDVTELEARFEKLYADLKAPASVEIMTIHGAKGLEFDMVIVPALERTSRPDSSPLLLAHPFARVGRDGMVLAARPPVGEEKDLLFEFLRSQADDAARLESQRLLYVACTRAKSRLLLTATLEEEARAPTGSLLQVLWPVHEASFAQSLPLAAAPMEESGLRGGPLERLPLGQLPEPIACEIGNTERQWPEFDWASETARRVGLLVHQELHDLSLQTASAQSLSAKEPDYRRWLASQGVPANRVAAGAARVVQALLAVLGDERGRWILSDNHQEPLREHALSGLHQGETLHAVFDRSFIDELGTRWVIDYKTSQHEGADLSEFLDREVQRYTPQMQRYARLGRLLGPQPLRVGLYFPLMRAWREWQPEP